MDDSMAKKKAAKKRTGAKKRAPKKAMAKKTVRKKVAKKAGGARKGLSQTTYTLSPALASIVGSTKSTRPQIVK
jgi:chromatin remodeling complex protein RSC6